MKTAGRNGSPADRFNTALVNKTVPWKFMGRELTVALSHALFSSFDIDAGSKLLLKTVAQRIDCARVRTLLDLGCGVGVLGLSVKARFPAITVTAVDRDALALAFTRQNAEKNGCKLQPGEGGFDVSGSVGLMHLAGGPYDLVLSNIPAKAGIRVIGNWLEGLTDLMDATGRLACVIVKTLEETAAQALERAGYETIWREGTREHTVIQARPTRAIAADRSLEPYRRGRMTLPGPGGRVAVETVTGLAEFDTLHYGTILLKKLAARFDCAGRVLVWNPGQGHLSALLSRQYGRRGLALTLAGRDLLSLEISRFNCLAAGVPKENLRIVHCASLFDVPEVYDRIIMTSDADAGVPWHVFFLDAVLPRLEPEGIVLAAAKSALLGRVDLSRGVRLLKDLRSKGFRGVAFRRSARSPSGRLLPHGGFLGYTSL